MLRIILITLLICPVLIFAAAPPATDSNPTLDLLVKKGIITSEERSQLIKDMSSQKIVDPAPVVVKPPSFLTVDPVVRHLTFTGRFQTQYFIDDYSQEGANAGNANVANEVFFRRLYLGVKADLDYGFSATLVANFAEPVWTANRSLDRAYMTWENKTLGTFDIGFKKVQWGVEENTSSSRLLTVERSATNRFWGEGPDVPGSPNTNLGFGARHIGFFYTKKWDLDAHNSLEYMFSLVNPQQGWSNKSINVFGIYSSLDYVLKLNEKNQHTLGLNYGYTPPYTQGTLNPSSSTPVVCGTGIGAISGFNPYIKSEFAGVTLEAEYLITRIGAAQNLFGSCNNYNAHTPHGYTFIAAYKFIPQVEGVIRYSVLDTDGVGTVLGQGVRDGVTTPLATTSYNMVRSYYAGINYYIKSNNIKLQLGYDHLDYSGYISGYLNGMPQMGNGSAAADTVRMQFQLNW